MSHANQLQVESCKPQARSLQANGFYLAARRLKLAAAF
jgi:hypothetical protein